MLNILMVLKYSVSILFKNLKTLKNKTIHLPAIANKCINIRNKILEIKNTHNSDFTQTKIVDVVL